MNSTPIPMRGFTMRTTPRASTVWSLRFKVTRARAPTARGLLVQTKQPPIEMSEVTPSLMFPSSRSRSSASAAKEKRMAYRLSRTAVRDWDFAMRSSMEMTLLTVVRTGPRRSDNRAAFPAMISLHEKEGLTGFSEGRHGERGNTTTGMGRVRRDCGLLVGTTKDRWLQECGGKQRVRLV